MYVQTCASETRHHTEGVGPSSILCQEITIGKDVSHETRTCLASVNWNGRVVRKKIRHYWSIRGSIRVCKSCTRKETIPLLASTSGHVEHWADRGARSDNATGRRNDEVQQTVTRDARSTSLTETEDTALSNRSKRLFAQVRREHTLNCVLQMRARWEHSTWATLMVSHVGTTFHATCLNRE